MEYKITNRGAEIYNLSSFDLAETFDCGQCFRWEALPCDETNGIQKFSAVVRGRYTTVYKHNNIFIIENCTEDELKNILSTISTSISIMMLSEPALCKNFLS